MKRPIFPFTFLFILFLIGCNNFKYSYWEISDFNLKLKLNKERNNKEVQIIYTSSYPSNYDELAVYIHYVAFISETNDTFNILSPMAYSMKVNELDTKFMLYNEKDLVYKAMMDVNMSHLEKNYGIKVKSLRYERILRDPKFDDIAKNNYETEIAIIFRAEDINTTRN